MPRQRCLRQTMTRASANYKRSPSGQAINNTADTLAMKGPCFGTVGLLVALLYVSQHAAAQGIMLEVESRP